MDRAVGIEAIAVAIPRHYLTLEDLADARGIAPAKYTVGLGAREMAVADPGEDTVALAATAAARLLDANDVDTSRVTSPSLSRRHQEPSASRASATTAARTRD